MSDGSNEGNSSINQGNSSINQGNSSINQGTNGVNHGKFNSDITTAGALFDQLVFDHNSTLPSDGAQNDAIDNLLRWEWVCVTCV